MGYGQAQRYCVHLPAEPGAYARGSRGGAEAAVAGLFRLMRARVSQRSHREGEIPGAKLVILPGVSHFAMLQDPDQFNRQSASFSRASSQSSSSPSASSAGAACRSTTLLGIVREQPLMTASMSRRVMMWQEQTIIEAWVSVGTAATLRRAHPTDDVFRRFQPASGGQSVSCPTQAALDTLSETLHVSMGGERRQSFCRDAALRASESRA